MSRGAGRVLDRYQRRGPEPGQEQALAVPTSVGVWMDRAVLHFLTEEADIAGYFDNLQAALKAGGGAIFSEFAGNGAEKCAGLPSTGIQWRN